MATACGCGFSSSRLTTFRPCCSASACNNWSSLIRPRSRAAWPTRIELVRASSSKSQSWPSSMKPRSTSTWPILRLPPSLLQALSFGFLAAGLAAGLGAGLAAGLAAPSAGLAAGFGGGPFPGAGGVAPGFFGGVGSFGGGVGGIVGFSFSWKNQSGYASDTLNAGRSAPPARRRLVVLVLLVLVVVVVFLVVVVLVVLLVVHAALGQGDLRRQLRRLRRLQQYLLFFTLAVLPQPEQTLVEQEHAVLAPGLNAGVDAVDLVLADQVLDGRRHHHHLEGGHQPGGLARQDRLRQDADQRGRELRPHLVLLFLGEHVDDAVDGRGRPGRVQRGEDDVARFGRLDGRVDRGQVAHFADQHDVGVHTQGTADGLGEVGHVHADLALVDRTLLVLVVILDRVLHRDDVPIVVLIDPVDHAGQAGRLARAGRPCHQQQAARPGDEPGDGVGHADLFKRQELARDAPHDHPDGALLFEDRGTEAVAVGKL